jgi:ABC-type dipeptide/oligopeptide/nickel transport system ATPase subunit
VGAFYSHFAYKYDDFKSSRIIDHIVLDLDFENLEDSGRVMSKLYGQLTEMKLNWHTYFSGNKGYHIVLPNAWGFVHQDISSKTLKNTLLELFPGIDESLYTSRSLIRAPDSINEKSGLYKRLIPNPWPFIKKIDEIKEVATRPYGQFQDFPELDKKHIELKKVYSIGKPLFAPIVVKSSVEKSPICINRILSVDPIVNFRHATSLRLLSHLIHYANLDPYYAVKVVEAWWSKSGEPRSGELDRMAENVQNGYRYGCRDNILAANCSHKCIFYKNRNYQSMQLNIKEIFDNYIQDIKDGNYIDMSTLFPDLIEKEFIVLNKDLVGIVGAPGCGKSTLALDIVMRMLEKNKETHAAILNLDNGHELSIRRMIQWITKTSKSQIIRPTKDAGKKINEALIHIAEHVELFDNPVIEEVDSMLYNWQKHFSKKPTVLVIDHVGNLASNTAIGGYEKMRYIGDFVKSIAKRHNILTLAIGHIRKGDSRENVITPESARDANLGPAADVLIGLTYRDSNSQTSNVDIDTKKILIMSSPKARDNEQFRFLVEYDAVTSSFTKVPEGTASKPMAFKKGHA